MSEEKWQPNQYSPILMLLNVWITMIALVLTLHKFLIIAENLRTKSQPWKSTIALGKKIPAMVMCFTKKGSRL